LILSKISPQHKAIAKRCASVFGGSPKVNRFWDNEKVSCIDLLRCEGAPQPGVTSFSTIGLSDETLKLEGNETDIRVELLGACGSGFKSFDNVLATTAFHIKNSGWFPEPLQIFPKMVAIHDASETMQHVFFLPPFLWEPEFATQTIGDHTISWLLVIPISDHEYTYAKTKGGGALEDLFVEKQIDVFDLNRPSVV
jgi:hypothetical protein